LGDFLPTQKHFVNATVVMKFLLPFLLVVTVVSLASGQDSVIELRNADVLSMIAAKVPTDTIIDRIETSRCHFDTFPPVISELRYRGVPEEILVAMVAAPVGRPSRTQNTRIESTPKPSAPVPAEKSELATSVPDKTAVSSAHNEEKLSDPVQDKSAGTTASVSSSVKVTEQVLTNDDLMKLLRSGTAAPDIVKQVRSSKGNYDFSGKALFELQQAGADATIFLSMMEASRAAQTEQKQREQQNNPSKSSKP
jgi:hypothetical protein